MLGSVVVLYERATAGLLSAWFESDEMRRFESEMGVIHFPPARPALGSPQSCLANLNTTYFLRELISQSTLQLLQRSKSHAHSSLKRIRNIREGVLLACRWRLGIKEQAILSTAAHNGAA